MFDRLKGNANNQDGLNPTDDRNNLRWSRGSSQGRQESSAPPPSSKEGYAAPPPEKEPPPAFQSNFASVSLHSSDKIRLLGLPVEQRDAVRASITRNWPQGIQREREYYGSHEFKLRGNPWYPTGDDALHARRVTRGVLSTIHDAGWILYITTDISRNEGDNDSLFFRHQSPSPTPREWFSLTFSKGDRIRLIDAPQDVVEATKRALQPETQRHEPYRLPGVYEIKLIGYPFQASGGETMVSRNLCLKLFSVFEAHGFTVSASMDQKYQGSGTETDSWHVSRPIGWAQGTPVYHQ